MWVAPLSGVDPPTAQPLVARSEATAKSGRGGGIRTHDFYVPNVARYQAALHPDMTNTNPGRVAFPWDRE